MGGYGRFGGRGGNGGSGDCLDYVKSLKNYETTLNLRIFKGLALQISGRVAHSMIR